MTVTNFFSSVHPWSLPEDRIDPPEPSDEQHERYIRNSLREEICQHIDSIDSKLAELEAEGFKDYLEPLAKLREEMRKDMEDASLWN